MVFKQEGQSASKMVRRRMIVKRNKSHNSTVGYRCNTIIENCKEICRDTRVKKIKKKRHACPAALIEQGEMARENDKAKKQKMVSIFLKSRR